MHLNKANDFLISCNLNVQFLSYLCEVNIYISPWVEVNGTLYKNNMVVLTSQFKFAKIVYILIDEKKEVHFVALQMSMIHFSQHVQAF